MMLRHPRIRTHIFALLLLMGTLVSALDARADGGFLSVIEDLPLMATLQENENAAVTFEAANGRIAEAEARGPVTPDAVGKFYADVLPQLGWKQVGDGLYARERERLRLTIESDGDNGAVVSFSVSPQESH